MGRKGVVFLLGVDRTPGFYPSKTVPRPILCASRDGCGHQTMFAIRPGAIQLCAWRCRCALSPEADLLPSLDTERPLAEAHREPLREQLWRGAAAPERHHRAARIARFREDAGSCDQRSEARGAGRAQ